MSWGIERGIEINYVQAIGSVQGTVNSLSRQLLFFWITHDAKATSRPDGEIVADPTFRSTCIDTSASNVVLSNADLIVFPFLESSIVSLLELSHSRDDKITPYGDECLATRRIVLMFEGYNFKQSYLNRLLTFCNSQKPLMTRERKITKIMNDNQTA